MPDLPKSHRVVANGLAHHVYEWASSCAAGERPRATLVLVHGYMDAAGTWDLIAPHLASEGYRVLAPDMRGYGDAPHVSRGAYYHFADYIADMAAILDALAPVDPEHSVALVGHSMGGTIVSLYAGSFPERVAKVALLEGVGPEGSSHDVAPDRMRLWIDQVRSVQTKDPARQVIASREDALRRLMMNHPGIAREVLASRLPHLVTELPDGRVRWKYDPLHKTRSPNLFFTETYIAFAKRIRSPVLFVSGGPNGYHPRDEAERLAAFENLRSEEITDAGHMMHWTRPERVTELLLDFFRT